MILAFDTSAAHCAAALFSDATVLSHQVRDMERGQAEALFPMLETILSEAQRTWSDITALAVGCGPGNFTGIRIAVSAARGLSMSLKIPAVGVTGFEAVVNDPTLPCWSTLPAVRDQIYLQKLPVTPESPPMVLPVDAARSHMAHTSLPIMGVLGVPPVARPDPVNIARVAADRLAKDESPGPPTPQYVRPPDAAPSRGQRTVILP